MRYAEVAYERARMLGYAPANRSACMCNVCGMEKDIHRCSDRKRLQDFQYDMQARAAEGVGGLGLLARQDLAAAAPVAAVLEAPALFALMQRLLQVRAAARLANFVSEAM